MFGDGTILFDRQTQTFYIQRSYFHEDGIHSHTEYRWEVMEDQ